MVPGTGLQVLHPPCASLRSTAPLQTMSAPDHAAEEGIIKLVFLREAGGASSHRKAVVPLVEGVSFDQFTMRVRRRLGLPDGSRITLTDAASGVVDTIDRLLEVDEGVTLDVASDVPSCLSQAVGTSASAATQRPMAGKGQALDGVANGAGGAAASPVKACRVDIPVSEWARSAREREDEDAGDGKYRKRRRGALGAMLSGRVLLGLAAGGILLYLLLGAVGNKT